MTGFVLAEKKRKGGWLTLSRPQALNALNAQMFIDVREALELWAVDRQVEYIVLQGQGRGFCAGGDIRQFYEVITQNNERRVADILIYEFALNQYIHTYPKPYISIINGLCMGGGMGVSVHGSHRVITENCIMAMPETAIGYYPDVGAGWFLNQCPGNIGMFLALTGYRLQPLDALYAGLATHFVSASSLNDLRIQIQDCGAGELNEMLDHYKEWPEGVSYLKKHRSEIDMYFGSVDLHQLLKNLYEANTDFSVSTLEILKRMCPLSLRMTFNHIKSCKNKTIQEVIGADIDMVRFWQDDPESLAEWCEGIRAAVMDKDQKPLWRSALT
ncbi:MAG: enoyl-CoA hydratase/isomerase family protein [Alphaproteobacteria bacterium]|nr:enoyl-CoA hydratase/isomerase family protein [Alphaproteobacteria bacterium]